MRLPFAHIALAAVAAFVLSACGQGGGQVTSDDMSLGDPKAPVTVIEYASASCPHCAEFNNDVFPAFKAKYIDTGKVHYVFREFLTPPENVAAAGFMTARCAGRDKYFSVLDAIYRGQRAMFQSGDFHGGFQRIAESAGVSDAQFEKCINDSDGLKALNARIDTYVKRDGIEATPTFVINGTKLSGEQTLATLDQAIAVAQGGKH